MKPPVLAPDLSDIFFWLFYVPFVVMGPPPSLKG